MTTPLPSSTSDSVTPDDDPNGPVWLSEEFDAKHREESEPLFGTGTIDLNDPSNNTDDDDDHDVPVFSKALRSLRNVFQGGGQQNQSTSTFSNSIQNPSKESNTQTTYGSVNENVLQTKNRVGQPLLFRIKIPEDDDNDEEVDVDDEIENGKQRQKRKTPSINEIEGHDFVWPDPKEEKKKNALLKKQQQQNKKNSNKTDDNSFDTLKQEGPNPFGKSILDKQKEKLAKDAADAYKPHMPRHNGILWIFHLVEGLATLSSICIIISQTITFLLMNQITSYTTIIEQIGYVSFIVKCDIICICILLIFNESNLPLSSCMKNTGILKSYIGRGYLYKFIGLICVESAYSDRMKEMLDMHKAEAAATAAASAAAAVTSNTIIVSSPGTLNIQDWIGIYMEASAWFMVGIGFLYILFGLLCLQPIRDTLHQKEINTWSEYRRNMKQWKELYKR